jgi:phosphoglycolate phosphatase-like HAD superfamily hydrolase
MNLVFLLDVDNTLLDNDRLKADLATRIEDAVGPQMAARFWEIYEQVRADEDYVDFPETIRRFAAEPAGAASSPELDRIIHAVPFRTYLYPNVLETIEYLNSLGEAVILSDGDPVFQPLKIRESGLAAAVGGRVLVYVHKEDELPSVFAAYPADHYVVVDDKPRIVSTLERCCPTTFTTVLVLQGKYARPEDANPKPDLVIEHIADLRNVSAHQFAAQRQGEIPAG